MKPRIPCLLSPRHFSGKSRGLLRLSDCHPKETSIRKLLKQLYLLRVICSLSFLVALGTTALIVALSFFQFSGYGPSVAGPVAQTTFANATAATTLFSTTGSTPGGHIVIPGPATPNLFNYYGFTALISWAVFGGGSHLAGACAFSLGSKSLQLRYF